MVYNRDMFKKNKKEPEYVFDVHCHVLFGLDDGAKSAGQAFCMLKTAYEEGIRGMILTPHYNMSHLSYTREEVEENLGILCGMIKEENLKMKLFLGNEVMYSAGVEEHLTDGKIMTMAGSRYVLVEFPISVSASYIENGVTGIFQSGYIPIVAHVERYEACLQDKDLIWELKDRGALIQVNASGVLGKHGKYEKKFCKELLKYGLVDFIATDAHRDNVRAPHIRECVSYVTGKYGYDYAYTIFCVNPQKVLKDEEIAEE